MESCQRYLGCRDVLKWASDITVYLPSERGISWHYLELSYQRSFMTKSFLQTFLIQCMALITVTRNIPHQEYCTEVSLVVLGGADAVELYTGEMFISLTEKRETYLL